MGDQDKEEMSISASIAALKIKVIDLVAKQGFSILLIFLIALYFAFTSNEKDHELKTQIEQQQLQTEAQIKTLEIEIKDCNDYTRKTQENIIKENTEVMREVLYELKHLER